VRALTVLREGAGPPVVLFPHAGGSPRFFQPWTGVLPGAHLVGVTYPGRDARMDERYADGPYGDDLAGLARAVAGELLATGLASARPVLAGHSLGALVAYETAVMLTGEDVPPVRLVVSGQNPPERRAATALHRGTDAELIADVVRQNPASAPLWEVEELRGIFLPALREDYRVLETYEPGDGIVPEILVCHGDRDAEVDPGAVADWNRRARTGHPPVVLDGGHFYLQPPDVQLPRLIAERFLTPG